MSHVIWYWNSAPNTWLTAATNEFDKIWKAYSDIQCDIIEEDFHTGEDQVTIDDYIIDLKQFLQINIDDDSNQRPIQRIVESHSEHCLRRARFSFPETSVEPFSGESYTGSTFIDKWRFAFDKNDIKSIVVAAAQGILEEGRKINQISELKWMSDQLRNTLIINKDDEECFDLPRFLWNRGQDCFILYSKESFLYKVINKTLREQDWTKIPTLGPFCFLLNSFLLHQVETQCPTRYRELV